MRDRELPVRVDSVFALRSFVEASKGITVSCSSVIIIPYYFSYF